MAGPPARGPSRAPIWQLALYGLVSLARGCVHPFVRLWRSTDPIDG
jgi:hypothetical protein